MMIIRVARETDIDVIGQMWLELATYHTRLDDRMPKVAPDGAYRYAQRIRSGLKDVYFQVYVAEENEQLIGYVFGTIIDMLPEMFVAERAGMIGDIYVQDSYRGVGVGSALMDAMKKWFRLRGVRHYEWYVAAANEAGIRFWTHAMHGEPVMIRMRASVEDE